MTSELKFLKYLDDAVEYERGKLKAIIKPCPPFSTNKIIEQTQKYDEQQFNTSHDCIQHMIANKTLKNIVIRRMFELLIRENFDQVDFTSLSQIPQYVAIKNKILNNNPELTHVDDGAFLRQIANAIAHGNYVKLLDIDKIEKEWELSKSKMSLDDFKSVSPTLYFQSMYSKDPKYGNTANNLLEKMNDKSSAVKLTPLELYQSILQSNISPAEFAEIRYESNYTIDQDGNRIKRPATQIYNLKVSLNDIDQVLFFIISSLKQETRIIPYQKNGTTIKPLNDSNSYRQDALKMLQVYDMVKHNYQDNTQEIVELDNAQKKFFINDYVNTRELFTKDFFKKIYGTNYMADVLSTNAGTQYFGLSNLFTNAKIEKLSSVSFALSNNIKSYFSFIEKALTNPDSQSTIDIIDDNHKKTYFYKQIFDVYSESLISEVLLLLQILEDHQQLSSLQNNAVVNSIIKRFSAKDLNEMQASSKYNDDSITVIHHLRNSFTHLTYLTNPNGDLYIYDQVSKRNKNQVYKFTINVKSLEKIKDELLSKVTAMYSTQSPVSTQ